MLPDRAARAIALFALAALTGCAAQRPSPQPSPLPRPAPAPGEPAAEARSPWGNGPIYEVHGRRYVVLPTSSGYHEQGIASWYGRKFHGRPTSSREPYDMYAMTAAHRTLPLPSWVRVTNLRNGKSVVVRINDRGPFVANRLIDLSYAAALALDMIDAGTVPVEVTALDYSPQPATTVAAAGEPIVAPQGDPRLFVQVGAFGDAENAKRRYEQLKSGGIEPASVHEDMNASPALYRVRVGPIADAAEYDAVVAKLRALGISEMQIVTER